MKKIYSLLFSVILISSCGSDDEPTIDSSNTEFQVIKSTLFDGNNDLIETCQYVYNDNILTMTCSSSDNDVNEFSYTFLDGLIQSVFANFDINNGSCAIDEKTLFFYELNKINSTKVYSNQQDCDLSYERINSYVYDDLGRLSKTIHVYNDLRFNSSSSVTTNYEYTNENTLEVYYNGEPSNTYTFSNLDKPVNLPILNTGDIELYTNNKLISKKDNGASRIIEYSYEFDNSGNMIKLATKQDGLSLYYWVFEYTPI